MSARFPYLIRNGISIVGLGLLLGSGMMAWRNIEPTSLDARPAVGSERSVSLAEAAEAGATSMRKEIAELKEEFTATYTGIFHATVYYTPLEHGFEKEAGFDVTPETRPGLAKSKYPRDFLKAVQLEGFGRVKEPVDGKSYVSYCGGRWAYTEAPLDRFGQPLQAMRSTAVGAGCDLIRPQSKFRIRAAGLPSAFLDARWMVCDTGGGLKPHQIDFYWGEDVPLGPGRQLSRPRGMPDAISKPTILVLR